jgi:hypothetical protein
MMQYGIALFSTDSSVIWAWKLLAEKAHPIKIIPKPEQYASKCSIALQFDWNQRQQLDKELSKANVEIEAIYFLSMPAL